MDIVCNDACRMTTRGEVCGEAHGGEAFDGRRDEGGLAEFRFDIAEFEGFSMAQLGLSTKGLCTTPLSDNPRGRVGGRGDILEPIVPDDPELVETWEGWDTTFPFNEVSERLFRTLPWKPLTQGGGGDTGDNGYDASGP